MNKDKKTAVSRQSFFVSYHTAAVSAQLGISCGLSCRCFLENPLRGRHGTGARVSAFEVFSFCSV